MLIAVNIYSARYKHHNNGVAERILNHAGQAGKYWNTDVSQRWQAFLAPAGCEALKKVSTMTYPRELEELTYEEIVRIILKKYTTEKN